MGRWRSLIGVAVAIAALALAACGGDDDGGGNPAPATEGATGAGSGEDGGKAVVDPSLSKADYAREVDAACKRNARERFAALTEYSEENPGAFEGEDPESEGLQGAAEEVIAPSMQDLAAEVRELGLPGEGTGQAERIVSTFEGVAEATTDAEGNLLTPEVGKALEKARSAAEGYGVSSCTFR